MALACDYTGWRKVTEYEPEPNRLVLIGIKHAYPVVGGAQAVRARRRGIPHKRVPYTGIREPHPLVGKAAYLLAAYRGVLAVEPKPYYRLVTVFSDHVDVDYIEEPGEAMKRYQSETASRFKDCICCFVSNPYGNIIAGEDYASENQLTEE